MHIFLDSNQLYSDPFFENINATELLNLLRKHKNKMYISTVVLDETFRNYNKQIEEKIFNLNKSAGKSAYLDKRINLEVNYQYSKEALAEEFDHFYDGLIEEGILEIIEYQNEFLPELVYRSINKIKPFSENKQEFRDGIIWLSYANYVEENDLETCFFISNNTNDFAKDDCIHPELEEDTVRFELVKSFKDLIRKFQEEVIFEDSIYSERYLKQKIVTGEVYNGPSLNNDYLADLFFRGADYIENDMNLTEGYFGEVDLFEVVDLGVISNHKNTNNTNIVVDGCLFVKYYVDLSERQLFYEKGDEYIHLGSKEITLSFDFTVEIRDSFSGFKIELGKIDVYRDKKIFS